jgi:hypothetical protein
MRRVLLALAGLHVALVAAVVALRIGYPYELEWLEGLSLHQVQRLSAGLPLYVPPSLAFIPVNYPPLYFALAAGMAHLLGPGFLALRLVSALAALCGLALIAAIVWRETRDAFAAALAAGLFAASFHAAGAFLDVARPDALYLALLLAGVAALRADGGPRSRGAVAGACFALAALTKQSGVVAIAPLVIGQLGWDRRRFAWCAGTLVVLLGASTAWLDRASHGWFLHYVLDIARAHRPEPGRLVASLGHDLLPLGLALAIGALYFSPGGAPRRGGRAFFGLLALGMIGSSAALRSYRGGFTNVLLTATASIALLFGLGLHAAIDRARGAPAAARRRGGSAIALAAIAQLALLAWDPRAQIPSRADRAAGDDAVRRLRAMPGAVLVPSHPYLLALAGRPMHVHEMAFTDAVPGRAGVIESSLMLAWRDSIARRAWSVIVLDSPDPAWLIDPIRRAYRPQGSVMRDGSSFFTVTGARTRPDRIWVPDTLATP